MSPRGATAAARLASHTPILVHSGSLLPGWLSQLVLSIHVEQELSAPQEPEQPPQRTDTTFPMTLQHSRERLHAFVFKLQKVTDVELIHHMKHQTRL